jgi:hypothetical protein
VVVPLRQLRHRVKNAELLPHPTDELYRRIKAHELLAEQIEIVALARLEQMSDKPSTAESTHDVIESVVRHFVESSSRNAQLPDTDIQSAIAILHSSARERPTSRHGWLTFRRT